MSSRFAFAYAAPFILLCGSAWLGCASTKVGATPEDLTRAHDQAAPGATVYANECASCHGGRGEGLASAPAILGARALPEYPHDTGGVGDPTITDPQLIQIQAQTRPAGAPWRDPFRNAQDLYTFTTTHLPTSRASGLKEARLLGRGHQLHAGRPGGQLAGRGRRSRRPLRRSPIPKR